MAEEAQVTVPKDKIFFDQGEQDPEYEHILHAEGWAWCVHCGEKVALKAHDGQFQDIVKSSHVEATFHVLDEDGNPTSSKKKQSLDYKITTISAESFFEQHEHYDEDMTETMKLIETKLKKG